MVHPKPDFSEDASKINNSVLPALQLNSKIKTNNYQAQVWFNQIKNTDKDIVKQLRLLPKLN